MQQFEFNILIHQPAEMVFEFIDRPEEYPKWQSGVIDASGDPDGKVGVGSQGWQVRNLFGRQVKMGFEVTGYEANRIKSYKSTSGPTNLEGSYIVDPVEEGSMFTVKFTSEPKGIMKLMEPIINRKVNAQWEDSLVRLKQLLESKSQT